MLEKNDNATLTISIIIIVVFILYLILSLINNLANLGRWKFIASLIDLVIQKIKFNKETWMLDNKLKRACLDLVIRTRYYKKFIWLDWLIHLILWLFFLILTILSETVYQNKSLIIHYYVMPFLLGTSPLWWLLFLTLVLYKFYKLEDFIKKKGIWNIKDIKAQKSKKATNKKDDETESYINKEWVKFIWVTEGMVFKKMKSFITRDESIRYFLGEKSKSIMYIYRYDIDNYKAPYFVFEHQQMIKNYEEVEWN
ncbi:hypothetical protein NPA08_03780 [Mycoplasmopsis citelli]|uniref:hypothetical protein n=1 Tax=Mycoplasmopsis citelli TaxID=171281 RepID=UPI0021140877|nr:hypothetical protein [Mycoplasmopsis citelli]UUD36047.1 hypothetical protein NPA08_03780 [Mycoplasmopsis citelli]